ncbi:uncharacterized protein LOC141910891 [Tubulanus polymorphus]|uniref:uncharacterized protein LOC141910891 n=1 Tax=Tubulanus polymorphus TaxID=672921 RepID=UPI003DA4E18D
MAESNPQINVDNSESVQIGDKCTMIINQCCHHEDKLSNERPPQNLEVNQVQKCLERTYDQMIDVEDYKEVWWSDKFINFHDFFTREHAKIRPRKQNENNEEQSVILPDDFEKLFAYYPRAMKRVCLVGEPGMGKTTQVINLVLNWTSSPTEFLKGFPMLFYIPLNDLPTDNPCIHTYIFENLLNQEIKQDLPISIFETFVRKNSEKAIFFLDGFDELKSDKAKKDIVRVINALPKAHIVITTRESGGSIIVTDPKFTVASISGFRMEEVIDIMRRKFPQRDPYDLFNMLSNKVTPLFKSIYYNPLILHMFCFLYMDEEEITVPSKLTNIYIDMTCFLISKREGFDLSSECFFGDIENSVALKQICKIAYETLIARQNSFSENRLKPDESKRTALTCKEVSPRHKSDRSVQLRFVHKSVQEFLAAVDSVVQFNDHCGEIPWNRCAFDQLPDELEKYGELYPRFVAGLLHRYMHNRGLAELFKTLIDDRFVKVKVEGFVDVFSRRNGLLMALVPDYERFIQLQSESYQLSDQLLIYLNEADCPDDAIGEIVHYMGKMLIVRVDSGFEINVLAKILRQNECPIEVVYIIDLNYELEPGGCADEYRELGTAITSNTSLRGMIVKTDTSSSLDGPNPYLPTCQKSNSIDWFVWEDGNNVCICYKKFNCEWTRTSRLITREDEDQLTSRDAFTKSREEILLIETAASSKLLGDIRKSYPFVKHLFLQVPPVKSENVIGELTKIIPVLKSVHLNEIFDEYLSGEEFNYFNNALKSSDIETIWLDLKKLTTSQWAEISDSVGSMPKLKHLFANARISRILDQLPQLTVLSIDLRSGADGDALVRYLSSNAVNELREVAISMERNITLPSYDKLKRYRRFVG